MILVFFYGKCESLNVIHKAFQAFSLLNHMIGGLWETDRVFGERSTTQQVYEQAIKEVALSVVRGINCE